MKPRPIYARRPRRVLDTSSGDVYHSIQHASRATGINFAHLQRAVHNGRPCHGRVFKITTAAPTVASDVSPRYVQPGDGRGLPARVGCRRRPPRHVRDLSTNVVYHTLAQAGRAVKIRPYRISQAIARGGKCRRRRWEFTTARPTVDADPIRNHRAARPVLVDGRLFPSMFAAGVSLGVRHTRIMDAVKRGHRCLGKTIILADSVRAMRLLGKRIARERRPARLENRLPILHWESTRVGA